MRYTIGVMCDQTKTFKIIFVDLFELNYYSSHLSKVVKMLSSLGI